jgi:hypothetical protein
MVSDQQWTILQQIGLKDPSGQQWSLINRKENVQHLVYDDAINPSDVARCKIEPEKQMLTSFKDCVMHRFL